MAVLNDPIPLPYSLLGNRLFLQMLNNIAYPKSGILFKLIGIPSAKQTELVKTSPFRTSVVGSSNEATMPGYSENLILARIGDALPSTQELKDHESITKLVAGLIKVFSPRRVRIFDRYLLSNSIEASNYKFLKD